MTSFILVLHATLIFSASFCWAHNCSSTESRRCEVDYAKNVEEIVRAVYEDLSLEVPEPENTGVNCGTKCSKDELGGIIDNIDELARQLAVADDCEDEEDDLRKATQQFGHDQDWLKLRDVLLDVLDPSDPAYQQAADNTWEKGEDALLEIIHSGHKELLEVLLDNGLDPNMRWKSNNATMLHEVAVTSHVDLAELLVSRGVFIDARAKWEVTPLLRASSAHQPKMVLWLLGHGANIKSTDYNGWTALHFAAKEDDQETVKILLDAGIDQNAINNDYLTAFELAESMQKTKVMSFKTPNRAFENE